MINLLSFLWEHVFVTATALASFAASIMAIVGAIKKDKKVLVNARKIAVWFFAAALVIVVFQYILSPKDSPISGEETQPPISFQAEPDDPRDSEITVSSVSLNKERVDLIVDDSVTLTATVLYSNNEMDSSVVWVSNDDTVAHVDETGTVFALSPGTAKIIAQAAKNNSAKTAECEIHVSQPITEPSGYSIFLSTNSAILGSPFKIHIIPNEENVTRIQVHAKAPSGHVDTFIWDSDKQYYINTEPGIWTIWATIENEVGTYEGSKTDELAAIEIASFIP